MRKQWLALLTILLVAAGLVMIAGNAFGAIWYVDKNSPGPVWDGHSWATAFQPIWAGISSAASGDEVWVKAAGQYVETITLKSGVSVYGGFAGTETQRSQRDFKTNVTTIDATLVTPRYHVVTMIGMTNTRLDGFTITGGNANAGSLPAPETP